MTLSAVSFAQKNASPRAAIFCLLFTCEFPFLAEVLQNLVVPSSFTLLTFSSCVWQKKTELSFKSDDTDRGTLSYYDDCIYYDVLCCCWLWIFIPRIIDLSHVWIYFIIAKIPFTSRSSSSWAWFLWNPHLNRSEQVLWNISEWIIIVLGLYRVTNNFHKEFQFDSTNQYFKQSCTIISVWETQKYYASIQNLIIVLSIQTKITYLSSAIATLS